MIIPTSASPTWVKSELAKKQDKLTQGDGIAISNNVVSVDLAEATQTSSGLMSAQDKKNLDTLKASEITEYVKGVTLDNYVLKITKSDGSTVQPTLTAVEVNPSTDNASYPVMLGTSTSKGFQSAKVVAGVTVNPSAKAITATKFYGALEGTASKAVADADGNAIASTYAKTGALSGYLPLAGGTMTGELKFNGGDAAGGSKIVLETGAGQITNSGTQTLFGFIGTTTLCCGHGSYVLALRGNTSKPTYNNKALALVSDIPDVSGFITQEALSGYATIGQIPDVSGFATKGEIPDVSGFATKSEVSLLPTFEPKVVSALPTSDISTKTLYLVPSDNGPNDQYDQYIYINGAWERIGSGMMTVDASMSSTSTNPVQNKVVHAALSAKADASALSAYALKTDLPTTAYIGTASQSITYAKVHGFGEWGTGTWYTKGFSLLLSARAGETVWVSVSADDSNTNAKAFRIMNTHSKIRKVYYSVSESAIYCELAAWANNLCATVIVNNAGDFAPLVNSATGLPSDAVNIPITEMGPTGSALNLGSSNLSLTLNGKDTRPTYNGEEVALLSDTSSLTAGSNISISGGVISATDSKVAQQSSTTDGAFPLLLKTSNNGTDETGAAKFASSVTVNPKTGHITATAFNGTASKAVADADGNQITSTYLPLTGGTLTGDLKISKTDQLMGEIGTLKLGSQASIGGVGGMIFLSANDSVSIGLDNVALQPVTMDSSTQIGLGTTSAPWSVIHGTTIYQNGVKVATVDDLAGVSGGGSGGSLSPSAYVKDVTWGTSSNRVVVTYGNNLTSEFSVGVVKQNVTSGLNQELPILTTMGSPSESLTSEVRFTSGMTLNPSKGSITATSFKGTADKAVADADGNIISSTYTKLSAPLQTIQGTTTDTPLYLHTTSNLGCFIGLKNKDGVVRYFGMNAQGQPIFYDNKDRRLALYSEIPSITASTTDIGEGATLTSGALYLVYE